MRLVSREYSVRNAFVSRLQALLGERRLSKTEMSELLLELEEELESLGLLKTTAQAVRAAYKLAQVQYLLVQ